MTDSPLCLRLLSCAVPSLLIWFGGAFWPQQDRREFPILSTTRSAGASRPLPFDFLYDGAKQIFQSSNIVLNRNDSINVQAPKENRAWSIHENFFFHDNDVRLHHGLDLEGYGLCSPDERPILVVLDGGAHYGSNAQRTIGEFVDPIHEQFTAIQASCTWPLRFRFVWMGLNAQSRSLDTLWLEQSREKAQQFNDVVDAYVAYAHGMVPLNFWNLTKDAAVSDGYHYLSDVNMYKATAILHVAHFLFGR